MQALEHLSNLPGSGPTSRRGSFSFTVVDAESLMPKFFAKTAALMDIKTEDLEELDNDSNDSIETETEDPPSLSSSTSISTSSSSATTPIKRSKRRLAAMSHAVIKREESPLGKRRATSASNHASAASMKPEELAARQTSSAPTGYTLPIPLNDGIKRVGIYSVEERRVRIAKFQAKRKRRVWRKKIKYDCRKKLADNRPRVKGRFVKREDEVDIALGNATQGMDQNAFLSQLGELLDD